MNFRRIWKMVMGEKNCYISAELKLSYLKKPYFVTMGMFHMGILLAFNNATSLPYKDLLESTQLPDKELTKQLQALLDTKLVSTEVGWDPVLLMQSSQKNISLKPQISKNSFELVKICDGLVKFKHDYRETRVWNSVTG